MDALLVALQFLTRIPVGRQVEVSNATLGSSVLYYPLVGFLIGVLLSVLALFLSATPDNVAAALVLVAWVWLTGGLHLDGLADCADACVGGMGSKERSLAIMKDPAAGPIAVMSLLLVLLLKWVVIVVLIQRHDLLTLILAPLLGRTAILLLMLSTPYVRAKGLAEHLIHNLPSAEARQVVVGTLIFCGFLMGWLNVLLICGFLLWLRYLAVRRLGGATGDVYGAAVELVETAALLTGVIL